MLYKLACGSDTQRQAPKVLVDSFINLDPTRISWSRSLRPPQVRRGRAREQGLFLPPGAGNVMRSGRALMEGLAQVGPAPVRGSSLEPVVSVELAAACAEQ